MMWYVAIIRLLRRRAVLAIIFFLSLTYCLVNLLGSVSFFSIENSNNMMQNAQLTYAFHFREDNVQMISKKLSTHERNH